MTKIYRNYNDESVEKTYKEIIENQTEEHVKRMRQKFMNPPYRKNSIWEITDKLNDIVDESDPDTDLPQIVHSYQTAESIKNRYLYNDGKLKDVQIRSLFSEEEFNNLPICYKKYDTTLSSYYSNINDWEWFPLDLFMI